MPLTLDADIPDVESRANQVENVLDEFDDIVNGNIPDELIGRQMLALLLAAISGKLTLKTEDRRDARSIMTQLVPSAPKKIELTQTVKPEEYIAKAMKDNEASFERLQAKSLEYEAIATDKLKALEVYNQTTLVATESLPGRNFVSTAERAVNATDIDQEGTVPPSERDS